jgi:hypothetical protein
VLQVVDRRARRAVASGVCEQPSELSVLEAWHDPAVAALEVRIAADGPGSAATVTAYADVEELDPDTRRRVRHRLGVCFGAAMRDWVDEPHW